MNKKYVEKAVATINETDKPSKAGIISKIILNAGFAVMLGAVWAGHNLLWLKILLTCISGSLLITSAIIEAICWRKNKRKPPEPQTDENESRPQ